MNLPASSLILNPLSLLPRLFAPTFLVKVFWLFSLTLLLSLLVFTFFQINHLAKEANSLRRLERKLTHLSQDYENWRLSAVQGDRELLAEQLMQELNFQKVEKLHFIKMPATEMAAK